MPAPKGHTWTRKALSDDTKKLCTKCKTWKPLDEFHNWKQSFDGKRPWCKECRKRKNGGDGGWKPGGIIIGDDRLRSDGTLNPYEL